MSLGLVVGAGFGLRVQVRETVVAMARVGVSARVSVWARVKVRVSVSGTVEGRG